VYYHYCWGIADSLSLPLMLAPLKSTDSEETTRLKVNEVARYLETFSVLRSVNFRNFGASSIRYTMYTLVKEIRNKDLASLKLIFSKNIDDMKEKINGVLSFKMHGMNKKFVKFLLARITSYIERQAGYASNFSMYFSQKEGVKPFEVEHIWADKFEQHLVEFKQKHEFDEYRNRLGDLLLLPQGTNQSYGAKPYKEKLEHYLKENLLAKSLHPKTYENNPNFSAMNKNLGGVFKSHETFDKKDIEERQLLLLQICNFIWGNSIQLHTE